MSEEQGIAGKSSNLFRSFDIRHVKLKGATRLETAENYTILGIVFGVVLFIIGMGLTAVSTTGISALLTIVGSFVSFVSTVALILVWLVKEFKSE
ncbi:hypothetical protein EPN87_00235 [archaeon]|nr:MAG: hypothetical protein EPN87_00235 [archaeon]